MCAHSTRGSWRLLMLSLSLPRGRHLALFFWAKDSSCLRSSRDLTTSSREHIRWDQRLRGRLVALGVTWLMTPFWNVWLWSDHVYTLPGKKYNFSITFISSQSCPSSEPPVVWKSTISRRVIMDFIIHYCLWMYVPVSSSSRLLSEEVLLSVSPLSLASLFSALSSSSSSRSLSEDKPGSVEALYNSCLKVSGRHSQTKCSILADCTVYRRCMATMNAVSVLTGDRRPCRAGCRGFVEGGTASLSCWLSVLEPVATQRYS